MAQIPNFKGIKPSIKPVVKPAATRGGDSLFGGYGSERAVPVAPKVTPTVSQVRPTGPTPTNNFFNYTLPTPPKPTVHRAAQFEPMAVANIQPSAATLLQRGFAANLGGVPPAPQPPPTPPGVFNTDPEQLQKYGGETYQPTAAQLAPPINPQNELNQFLGVDPDFWKRNSANFVPGFLDPDFLQTIEPEYRSTPNIAGTPYRATGTLGGGEKAPAPWQEIHNTIGDAAAWGTAPLIMAGLTAADLGGVRNEAGGTMMAGNIALTVASVASKLKKGQFVQAAKDIGLLVTVLGGVAAREQIMQATGGMDISGWIDIGTSKGLTRGLNETFFPKKSIGSSQQVYDDATNIFIEQKLKEYLGDDYEVPMQVLQGISETMRGTNISHYPPDPLGKIFGEMWGNTKEMFRGPKPSRATLIQQMRDYYGEGASIYDIPGPDRFGRIVKDPEVRAKVNPGEPDLTPEQYMAENKYFVGQNKEAARRDLNEVIKRREDDIEQQMRAAGFFYGVRGTTSVANVDSFLQHPSYIENPEIRSDLQLATDTFYQASLAYRTAELNYMRLVNEGQHLEEYMAQTGGAPTVSQLLAEARLRPVSEDGLSFRPDDSQYMKQIRTSQAGEIETIQESLLNPKDSRGNPIEGATSINMYDEISSGDQISSLASFTDEQLKAFQQWKSGMEKGRNDPEQLFRIKSDDTGRVVPPAELNSVFTKYFMPAPSMLYPQYDDITGEPIKSRYQIERQKDIDQLKQENKIPGMEFSDNDLMAETLWHPDFYDPINNFNQGYDSARVLSSELQEDMLPYKALNQGMMEGRYDPDQNPLGARASAPIPPDFIGFPKDNPSYDQITRTLEEEITVPLEDASLIKELKAELQLLLQKKNEINTRMKNPGENKQELIKEGAEIKNQTAEINKQLTPAIKPTDQITVEQWKKIIQASPIVQDYHYAASDLKAFLDKSNQWHRSTMGQKVKSGEYKTLTTTKSGEVTYTQAQLLKEARTGEWKLGTSMYGGLTENESFRQRYGQGTAGNLFLTPSGNRGTFQDRGWDAVDDMLYTDKNLGTRVKIEPIKFKTQPYEQWTNFIGDTGNKDRRIFSMVVNVTGGKLPRWLDKHHMFRGEENPVGRIYGEIVKLANGKRVLWLHEIQGPGEIGKPITNSREGDRLDMPKRYDWSEEKNNQAFKLLLIQTISLAKGKGLDGVAWSNGDSQKAIRDRDGLKRLYDEVMPRMLNDMLKEFGIGPMTKTNFVGDNIYGDHPFLDITPPEVDKMLEKGIGIAQKPEKEEEKRAIA